MAEDSRSGQVVLSEHAAEHGARSAARFDFMMRRIMFHGVDLQGKRVLDVGAGNGRMGMWAAAHGASRVVGLEPEADGSRPGAQEKFRAVVERAGLEDRVELIPKRLQDYETDERFDVLLMVASVNHLDEDACIRLHEDEAARETYRGHLRLLADLATPGATLIATDARPKNLFPRLGIRNPLAPTIEWHKHQEPELWAQLLGDVGFVDPEIRWLTLNGLGRPGVTILANRPVSYALTSSFHLKMRRGA